MPSLANIWGSVEVNISASIRAPYTKCFLEFPEIHRNISDYMGGVDTPVGRVLVPKHLARLSKYMEDCGDPHLSFYECPIHYIIGGCWDT